MTGAGLCVIGNSHVAMLKDALPDAVFFAQPGKGPAAVEFIDGGLFTIDQALSSDLTRMGMPTRLEFSDFDAVVIVGMAPTLFHLVPITAKCHVSDWPGAWSTALADPYGPALTRPLVTAAMLRAEIAQRSQTCLTHRYAQAAGATGRPVLVLSQPAPSVAILDDPSFGNWKRMIERDLGAAHLDLLNAGIHDGFAELGVTHIAQPASSLVHGCLTSPEYMRGSKRLETGDQPADDILHGNAALGRALADQIAQALAI